MAPRVMTNVLKLLKLCGTAVALLVYDRVYLTVIIDRPGPITESRAGSITITAKDRIRCKGTLKTLSGVIMAIMALNR